MSSSSSLSEEGANSLDWVHALGRSLFAGSALKTLESRLSLRGKLMEENCRLLLRFSLLWVFEALERLTIYIGWTFIIIILFGGLSIPSPFHLKFNIKNMLHPHSHHHLPNLYPIEPENWGQSDPPPVTLKNLSQNLTFLEKQYHIKAVSKSTPKSRGKAQFASVPVRKTHHK